jgi:predicted SprT family Zn-dependent metalloprotease
MAQQTAEGTTQATFDEMTHAVAESQPTPAPAPEPSTHEELLDAARAHASEVTAEHFPEHAEEIEAIEWRVSTKATRSSGACKYNRRTGEVTIRLTWAAFQKYGWEKFSATVRHELIHAYEYITTGESDHGWKFRMFADDLDCSVHCESFTTPKYWVYCPAESCEFSIGRMKRSKTVKKPERYECPKCAGQLESKPNSDA